MPYKQFFNNCKSLAEICGYMELFSGARQFFFSVKVEMVEIKEKIRGFSL